MIQGLKWLPAALLLALTAAMLLMTAFFVEESQADLSDVMLGLFRYQPAWLFYSVVLFVLAVAFAAVAALSEYENRTLESSYSSAVRGLRAEITEQKDTVTKLKTDLHMTLIELEAAKKKLQKQQDHDTAQVYMAETRKHRIKNALLRSK